MKNDANIRNVTFVKFKCFETKKDEEEEEKQVTRHRHSNNKLN